MTENEKKWKKSNLLDDLSVLPPETLEPIKAVVKAFAQKERGK